MTIRKMATSIALASALVLAPAMSGVTAAVGLQAPSDATTSPQRAQQHAPENEEQPPAPAQPGSPEHTGETEQPAQEAEPDSGSEQEQQEEQGLADVTAPAAPTVSAEHPLLLQRANANADSTVITGSAEAHSTVKFYDEAGALLQAQKTGADGRFRITFTPKLPNGTVLFLTATDAAGNESERARYVVDDRPAVAPIVAPSNGSVIRGTGTPEFRVEVLLPNKTILRTTVAEDGSWSVVPEEGLLQHGDTVSVTQLNLTPRRSPAAVITIDQEAPNAPDLDVSDGHTVTGRPIEEGAIVTVVNEAGETVPGTIVVSTEGDLTFTPVTRLQESDQVFVVVTDLAGNSSTPVRVVIDTTGPIDHGTSQLEVTSARVLANGADAHTATATVRDEGGRPLSGIAVSFAAEDGANLAAETVTTDQAGVALVTITSLRAGEYAITATVGDAPLSGSPKTVTFIADQPDLDRSFLSVSDGTRVANGEDSHLATVTVLDPHGNPVEGIKVAFTAGAGATLQASLVTTNEDGIAETAVTSTTVGSISISASIGGTGVGQSPQQAVFVAGAPNAQKSELGATSGDRLADGRAQHAVTATIVDATGNPIRGALVSFEGATNALLSAESATTNSAGVATITVTSKVAGDYSISATVGEEALRGSPQSVRFVAGAPQLDRSQLRVSEGTRVADGVGQHTATATVRDSLGNPVPGVLIEYAVTEGATLSHTTAETSASGVAEVTVTSTVAGTYEVAATLGGQAVPGSPGSLTFVAGLPSVTEHSELSVSTGAVLANGSDRHTATVLVRDAHLNPIEGIRVDFSAGAAATLSDGHAVTNAAGLARVTLTSLTSGMVEVRAAVDSVEVKNSPRVVEFAAGAAQAGKSFWTVTPDRALAADGTAAFTATVTLRDEHNNAVPNSAVRFHAPVGITLPAGPYLTNDQGVATVQITSKVAGSFPLSAHTGAKKIGETLTVEFEAGPPVVGEDSSSLFTVSEGSRVADGRDTHKAHALLQDRFGNPVAGATVAFEVSAGATPSARTAQTGADGKASITVTSAIAGDYTVHARYEGGLIQGSPRTVTFVSGDWSPERSALSVTSGERLANGVASHTATATVQDERGNAVAGVVVDFDAEGGAYPSVTWAETDENGEASVAIRSLVVGTFEVSAQVSGTALRESPQPVTFVAGKPAPERSELRVSPGTRVADGASTHEAWAWVYDENRNPVRDTEVSFAVTGNAKLEASTVKTDEQGFVRARFTSKQVETVQISASIAGTELLNSPRSASFVAGPGDAGASELTSSEGTRLADGVERHTITAQVRDAQGNSVRGARVEFTGEAGALLSANAAVSDASGTAQITVRSREVGNQKIRATLAGVAVTGSPQAVSFVAGPVNPEQSELTVSQGEVEANGTATHTATVQARDSSGHPLSGIAVDVAVSSGAKLSQSRVITDEAGVAAATITSERAGSVEVSATVDSAPVRNSPQTVTFAVGAASAVTSFWSVTPAGEVVANDRDAYTAQVTVRDAKKNPVPNATVTFDAPDGLKLTPEQFITNEEGVVTATITSRVAGSYQVRALLGGDQIQQSQELEFLAGAASERTSTISASPKEAEANGSHPVTVRVQLRDALGNQVNRGGVDLRILSSRGTVSAVTDHGDGSFTATATSRTAGMATFSLALADIPGLNTATVEFIASPKTPVVGPTNGVIVGGTADTMVTITVADRNGQELGQGRTGAGGAFAITLTGATKHGDVLTVTATNRVGFTSAPAFVTVDQEAPQVPEVDASNGKIISGRGLDAGDTVAVVDGHGTPIPGAVTLGDNGEFSFVPLSPLSEGDIVRVIVTDPAGNSSAPVDVVVDTTPPPVPEVDPTNGARITGGGIESGGTLSVIDAEGNRVPGKVSIDREGFFTFEPEAKLLHGDLIRVIVSDHVGNESVSQAVEVDTVRPDAPLVDGMERPDGRSSQARSGNSSDTGEPASTRITGSAELESTVRVYDEQWNLLASQRVNDEGRFSFTFTPGFAAGTVLLLTATDRAGNESLPNRIIVDHRTPTVPEIAPSDGSVIRGTGIPGMTIVLQLPAGVELRALVAEDTSWSVTPEPGSLAHGDLVQAHQQNLGGRKSDTASIRIQQHPPHAPTVAKSNGWTVEGSGLEPGNRAELLDNTGTVLVAETQLIDGGTFVITPEQRLSETGSYRVEAVHPSGQRSEPVGVVVDTTPPEAPVVERSNGVFVTGGTVAEEDTLSVRNVRDEHIPGVLVVDNSGRFTFTPEVRLSESEEVLVVVEDSVGNDVRVPVDIDSTPPVVERVLPTEGGSVLGKTEGGAAVEVHSQAGALLGTGTAADDGSFTVEMTPAQPEGATIRVRALDAVKNVSEAQSVRVGLTSLVVEHESVRQGATQRVFGYGFQPGERVTAAVSGHSLRILEQQASAGGEVTFSFEVPDSLVAGRHTVTATAPFSGDTSSGFSVEAGKQEPGVPVAPETPTGPATGQGTGTPVSGGPKAPATEKKLSKTGADGLGAALTLGLLGMSAGAWFLIARGRQAAEEGEHRRA